MNLFNCFQSMAIYTGMPFVIQYLFQNGHNGFGYALCAVQVVCYFIVVNLIHEKVDK